MPRLSPRPSASRAPPSRGRARPRPSRAFATGPSPTKVARRYRGTGDARPRRMERTNLEAEIAELERRYWDAIKDKDVDACNALNDERIVVAGPSGVATIDRAAFASMMEKGKWTLRSFSFSDMRVQPLGADAAVVAYKVHEELDVEGRPISLDAADSSVWVRRAGGWRCAAHTEALRGDPYGRDKVTPQTLG